MGFGFGSSHTLLLPFLPASQPLPLPRDSHVGLVVLPNLLDAYIVFGINEGLGGGIRLGQCHDTRNVLEVMLVVHLDLWEWGGSQGPVRTGR